MEDEIGAGDGSSEGTTTLISHLAFAVAVAAAFGTPSSGIPPWGERGANQFTYVNGVRFLL